MSKDSFLVNDAKSIEAKVISGIQKSANLSSSFTVILWYPNKKNFYFLRRPFLVVRANLSQDNNSTAIQTS